MTTVKLGYNKKIFELLYFKGLKQKRDTKIFSNGLTHFSITVKNLDKLYVALKNNIKFLSKPTMSYDNKVKLVFCKSPENIFIELVEVTMYKIGFMQGRLVKSENLILSNLFLEELEKEFYLANKNKIKILEWTLDFEKFDQNPLIDKKHPTIKKLKNNIKINSVT